MSERDVIIDYTNHRGERAERKISPRIMFFGTSEHHGSTPQWLMQAHDHDRDATRTFAMKDVHSWRPCDP